MESIILTSSVISAIVSASIAGIISLRTKKLDFRYAYYKTILEKRITAYQFIESQVAVLKTTIIDQDNKPYYAIFDTGYDDFFKFQQNLYAAMSYSLWIGDNTITVMQELNDIFYNLSLTETDSNDELISKGKNNYKAIAKIRKSIEDNIKKDMLQLDDIDKFLKTKASGESRIIKKHDNTLG